MASAASNAAIAVLELVVVLEHRAVIVMGRVAGGVDPQRPLGEGLGFVEALQSGQRDRQQVERAEMARRDLDRLAKAALGVAQAAALQRRHALLQQPVDVLHRA